MEVGLLEILPVETGPNTMPWQSKSYKLPVCIGHQMPQAAVHQNQGLPALGKGPARLPLKQSPG